MQIKQNTYLPASALKMNYLKELERVLGKFWHLAAALVNWELQHLIIHIKSRMFFFQKSSLPFKQTTVTFGVTEPLLLLCVPWVLVPSHIFKDSIRW